MSFVTKTPDYRAPALSSNCSQCHRKRQSARRNFALLWPAEHAKTAAPSAKGTAIKRRRLEGAVSAILPLPQAASVRGQAGSIVLDRLRNVDRLGGRLLPSDRLGLAHQRARQHLIHARDRNDVEAALDAVVDLDKILGVLFR